jgi:hypothetical protein
MEGEAEQDAPPSAGRAWVFFAEDGGSEDLGP